MKRDEVSLEMATGTCLLSHFLIDKASKADLLKVVGKLCGLNAQTARAPYLSLWSRVEGFEKGRLVEALYEDKVLIKTWLMRGTVHIVPVLDFPVYQKALRRSLVSEWERVMKRLGLTFPDRRRANIERRILDALSLDSLTKRELMPHVRDFLLGFSEREQKTLVSRLLRELSYRGLVCHGEPTGPWYHFKENRFTLVDRWLSGVDWDSQDEREARRELLLRYLRGYGPTTVQDFAYWAGLRVSESREIFLDMMDELKEVTIRDVRGSFWMVSEDVDALEASSVKGERSVRFLPEFDPLIMGHKDKSRIMGQKHRNKVFLPLADVAPTVLAGGRVVGTWSFKRTEGSFEMDLFEKGMGEEMEEESVRLVEFLSSD